MASMVLNSRHQESGGQIRSPRASVEFPQQRRSGSWFEKISGPTRDEEQSDSRGPQWLMERRWAALSQARRSASDHGDFLGAGGCSGGGELDGDVADGNAARQVVSRVLNMMWAGVIAARRVGGQVLNVVWASGSAARRFGRRVLDVAWLGGSAARRFGGRVLDMAWAGGSAAIRFGGWVLGVTLASVSAARRFGGRDLDMASGDVHAWPVTTEVRALPVYVRVVRSVGGGVRGVGVGAVPL